MAEKNFNELLGNDLDIDVDGVLGFGVSLTKPNFEIVSQAFPRVCFIDFLCTIRPVTAQSCLLTSSRMPVATIKISQSCQVFFSYSRCVLAKSCTPEKPTTIPVSTKSIFEEELPSVPHVMWWYGLKAVSLDRRTCTYFLQFPPNLPPLPWSMTSGLLMISEFIHPKDREHSTCQKASKKIGLICNIINQNNRFYNTFIYFLLFGLSWVSSFVDCTNAAREAEFQICSESTRRVCWVGLQLPTSTSNGPFGGEFPSSLLGWQLDCRFPQLPRIVRLLGPWN
jgi:hypothetical protein